MKTKKRLSSVEAAYKILKREKRAMKPKEIIEIAFKEYGLKMNGKTPHATLDANFYNERKRRRKLNREQRFVKVSRGMWGLVEYLDLHYEIE